MTSPIGPAMVLALFAMATTDSGAHPAAVNRLAGESSPYLLQHQHNPVDWYPWGDEAFEKAKHDDRPIFLSIGYSTCHWCHVMERESFENTEIAVLLNRNFVSIKVDREERPDLDNVYMTACQLMTHSGGWPLTAILTPDGRPFFAGTYFPPDDRYGRAGMKTLLPRIAEAWKNNRAEIEQQASHVAEVVTEAIQAPPKDGSAAPLDASFGDGLLDELGRRFDAGNGGFSDSPKFPPHGAFQFLLDRCRRRPDSAAEKMLRRTLDAMQDGGIFDHVGGGFHRYSVDSEWLLPHFEKMLYDNAQLLEIYSSAYALFHDRRYRETALRTFDWLEREMRTAEGGYASALDADTEGVEGKTYLWKASEIDSLLGKTEAPLFREAFGIRDTGNLPAQFEEGRGENLPHRTSTDEDLGRKLGLPASRVAERLAADERALESVRAKRPQPSRDDKVVTSWNALAVTALVHGARDLEDPSLLDAARRIAALLLKKHLSGDRVWHVSRGGSAKIGGFLDDSAFFARALLDLSEATGDPELARRARSIAEMMIARFSDPVSGGFFQTAAPDLGHAGAVATAQAEKRGLLNSSKEFLDQVLPSPNGIAVEVLRRLDAKETSAEFRAASGRAMAALAPFARAFPGASTTAAILSASNAASSSPLVSSARSGPVQATLVLEDKAARSGTPVLARVRIEIDPGWHIQSHRPGRPDLVATDVRPLDGAVAFGDPIYPAGAEILVAGEKLSTYSGALDIPISGSISPAAAAGEIAWRIRIEFQACDDRRCLAPSRLDLGASLRTEK